MDGFVGIEMVGGRAGFHRFGKNHIAVVVVDNEEVGIAVA